MKGELVKVAEKGCKLVSFGFGWDFERSVWNRMFKIRTISASIKLRQHLKTEHAEIRTSFCPDFGTLLYLKNVSCFGT